MSKHLVVARFNEDLKWLELLPLEDIDHIFIYNKGPNDVKLSFFPSSGKQTISVIKLPNVGKCDHTYLYHIITNWNNLGDVTIFLPGSGNDTAKWYNTIYVFGRAVKTIDSFFVLSEVAESVFEKFKTIAIGDYKTKNEDNQKLCAETKLDPCPMRPFGKWYLHHFPNTTIHHVAYFGIFAVSKTHIKQNTSFDKYVELYTSVNTHPNPEVGHYIERSWMAIFYPINISKHGKLLPNNSYLSVQKEFIDHFDKTQLYNITAQ
jgi:hypothetical protein